MSTKTIGFVMIALGVIIVLVSLAADAIGIGNQVQPGIGLKQLLGIAIGFVMALVGVWLGSRKLIQKK